MSAPLIQGRSSRSAAAAAAAALSQSTQAAAAQQSKAAAAPADPTAPGPALRARRAAFAGQISEDAHMLAPDDDACGLTCVSTPGEWLTHRGAPFTSIDFHPAGDRFVTTCAQTRSSTSTVRIWAVKPLTNKADVLRRTDRFRDALDAAAEAEEHPDALAAAAEKAAIAAAAGPLLGGGNAGAALMDASTFFLLAELPLDKIVVVARFSPCGKFLLCVEESGSITLWTPADPNAPQPAAAAAHAGSFSGFGAAPASTVALPETWTRVQATHVKSPVFALAWAPSSRGFAVGCMDNTVALFTAPSLRASKAISAHNDWVIALAWDPLDRYLACLYAGGIAAVFSVGDWALVAKVDANTGANLLGAPLPPADADDDAREAWAGATAVTACRISWSPTGTTLVVSRTHRGVPTAVTLRRESWAVEGQHVAHSSPVISAVFSPRLYAERAFAPDSNTDTGAVRILPGESLFSLMVTGAADGSLTLWASHRERAVMTIEDLVGVDMGALIAHQDDKYIVEAARVGEQAAVDFLAKRREGTLARLAAAGIGLKSRVAQQRLALVAPAPRSSQRAAIVDVAWSPRGDVFVAVTASGEAVCVRVGLVPWAAVDRVASARPGAAESTTGAKPAAGSMSLVEARRVVIEEGLRASPMGDARVLWTVLPPHKVQAACRAHFGDSAVVRMLLGGALLPESQAAMRHALAELAAANANNQQYENAEALLAATGPRTLTVEGAGGANVPLVARKKRPAGESEGGAADAGDAKKAKSAADAAAPAAAPAAAVHQPQVTVLTAQRATVGPDGKKRITLAPAAPGAPAVPVPAAPVAAVAAAPMMAAAPPMDAGALVALFQQAVSSPDTAMKMLAAFGSLLGAGTVAAMRTVAAAPAAPVAAAPVAAAAAVAVTEKRPLLLPVAIPRPGVGGGLPLRQTLGLAGSVPRDEDARARCEMFVAIAEEVAMGAGSALHSMSSSSSSSSASVSPGNFTVEAVVATLPGGGSAVSARLVYMQPAEDPDAEPVVAPVWGTQLSATTSSAQPAAVPVAIAATLRHVCVVTAALRSPSAAPVPPPPTSALYVYQLHVLTALGVPVCAPLTLPNAAGLHACALTDVPGKAGGEEALLLLHGDGALRVLELPSLRAVVDATVADILPAQTATSLPQGVCARVTAQGVPVVSLVSGEAFAFHPRARMWTRVWGRERAIPPAIATTMTDAAGEMSAIIGSDAAVNAATSASSTSATTATELALHLSVCVLARASRDYPALLTAYAGECARRAPYSKLAEARLTTLCDAFAPPKTPGYGVALDDAAYTDGEEAWPRAGVDAAGLWSPRFLGHSKLLLLERAVLPSVAAAHGSLGGFVQGYTQAIARARAYLAELGVSEK